MNKNPLDQFEIINYISLNAPLLANLHLSVNNISLYLTTSVLIILILNELTINYDKIVSNK